MLLPEIRYDALPDNLLNATLEFFSWNNLMFGADDNKTPYVHYHIVNHYFAKYNRALSLCSRGLAKSTLTTERLPLFISSMGKFPNFGTVSNIVIVSATIDQAQEQLANMLAKYEASEPLKAIMTLAKKPKVDELVFLNSLNQKIFIQAIGVGQSKRGTRKEGQRPQLIIFDDLLPDKILDSKKLNEDIIKWFFSVLMPMVDINRFKVIGVGTPFNDSDIYAGMKKSSKWRVLEIPIAKVMPVDSVEEIESAWPDRFTPQKIMDMYEDAKSMDSLGDFYREYMLEVRSRDTGIFKESWFREFIRPERIEYDKYNFFTSMDLAVSKKESADLTVVITIAVDSDHNWFIYEISFGKMSPTQVIDRLFQHVRKYRPLKVKAERAALQQVLGHFIEEKMKKEKEYFFYDYLSNNSVQSKEQRVFGLEPLFKNRKIYFPSNYSKSGIDELKNELLSFTNEGFSSRYKDVADCLANFLDDDFVVYPKESPSYNYSYDEFERYPSSTTF